MRSLTAPSLEVVQGPFKGKGLVDGNRAEMKVLRLTEVLEIGEEPPVLCGLGALLSGLRVSARVQRPQDERQKERTGHTDEEDL